MSIDAKLVDMAMPEYGPKAQDTIFKDSFRYGSMWPLSVTGCYEKGLFRKFFLVGPREVAFHVMANTNLKVFSKHSNFMKGKFQEVYRLPLASTLNEGEDPRT